MNEETKAEFKPKGLLTVHWDGKLLPYLCGHQKVDRLSVIVTGVDTEKLLAVPKLDSGSSKAQADAVLDCLNDYHVLNQVTALCFDTTASNTSSYNEACNLIEKALGRNVLNFACRHHVMEIMLEKVFMALNLSLSTGPDIAIFKRFRDKWPSINVDSYSTADNDDIISFKESTIEFAMALLTQSQPRDDYRECLELTIIFLGGKPPRGVHIQAAGALHRARWMARILYSFKIWMYKDQLMLKSSEERGIYQFLIFVSSIYIKAWFNAPNPAEAPMNDLT